MASSWILMPWDLMRVLGQVGAFLEHVLRVPAGRWAGSLGCLVLLSLVSPHYPAASIAVSA